MLVLALLVRRKKKQQPNLHERRRIYEHSRLGGDSPLARLLYLIKTYISTDNRAATAVQLYALRMLLLTYYNVIFSQSHYTDSCTLLSTHTRHSDTWNTPRHPASEPSRERTKNPREKLSRPVHPHEARER